MDWSGETIAAPSTSLGGALVVVRISGPIAFTAVNSLLNRPLCSSHLHGKTSLAIVMDGIEPLDEVVLVCYEAPSSFTGENTVEISFHGSPFIVGRALQLLAALGVRPALPGEFTKRAFLNGKLNLTRAEAVADLIAANSKMAAKMAFQQMKGGIEKEIVELREKLIQFSALIELELDFSEEDVAFANREQLRILLLSALERVMDLKKSFQIGRVFKQGIPVAIMGPPNAGKSTLLNAFLREDRALVTPIAGTTRDTIEEQMTVGGVNLRFIDTAGIRETNDVVEQMGIARSIEALKRAEVFLYVCDASENSFLDAQEASNKLLISNVEQPALSIIVGNKSDKKVIPDWENHPFLISATSGQGVQKLEEYIVEHFVSQVLEGGTVVIQARHAEALSRAGIQLKEALTALENGVSSEFFSIDLKGAIATLAELLGEVGSEEILGAIFSKFCIGK
jgi:tRNA modification GTPase